MAAYYSVVQFVPDPIADERMNIGVIVTGDGHVRSRFLSDWEKAHRFAGTDINFLKEFAKQISRSEPPQNWMLDGQTVGRVDAETLKRMASGWINSIQITEPRASLEEPAKLLTEVSARFLRVPARAGRSYRDRSQAASFAVRHIREVLTERSIDLAHKYLKRHYDIIGKVDEHQFDVGVANGRVLFAAHGLSFEVQDTKELEREFESVVWAFDDVKNRDPGMELAVVAFPPKGPSKVYDRAQRVFSRLNVPVLIEEEVDMWAREKARAIPVAGD